MITALPPPRGINADEAALLVTACHVVTISGERALRRTKAGFRLEV